MTLYRTIAYIETFSVLDNPTKRIPKCNLSNLFDLFECLHLKQSNAYVVDVCYAKSNV
jgi:ubiquitin C-terminal hydrolase